MLTKNFFQSQILIFLRLLSHAQVAARHFSSDVESNVNGRTKLGFSNVYEFYNRVNFERESYVQDRAIENDASERCNGYHVRLYSSHCSP